MTAWQIIKLIPLILEAVKILKNLKDKDRDVLNNENIYQIFSLNGNKSLVNKISKHKLLDKDVETIVNFALLIIKLTGK